MFIKTSSRGFLLCYACISVIVLVLLFTLEENNKLISLNKEQILLSKNTITEVGKIAHLTKQNTDDCRQYISTTNTTSLAILSNSTDSLLRTSEALQLIQEQTSNSQQTIRILRLLVIEHVDYVDKIIAAVQKNATTIATDIYNASVLGQTDKQIGKVLSAILQKEMSIRKTGELTISKTEKRNNIYYTLLVVFILLGIVLPVLHKRK